MSEVTGGAASPATAAGGAGDIESRIKDVIVREGMVDREALTPDATLDSLGVTSVDIVMILNGLEEEFGIYIPMDQTLQELKNVNDLVTAVTRLVATGKPT